KQGGELEVLRDAAARGLQRLLADVDEHDLVPGLREELGDSRADHAGADHSDPPEPHRRTIAVAATFVNPPGQMRAVFSPLFLLAVGPGAGALRSARTGGPGSRPPSKTGRSRVSSRGCSGPPGASLGMRGTSGRRYGIARLSTWRGIVRRGSG